MILGIETSCDETAAAILQEQGKRITMLSNVIASSATLQAKYGGVIPEQAAREQIKSIIPVIEEALQQSGVEPLNLGAIAVTYGPGLIGSLLVGVETAKTLATIWQKPLIPINHLIGHFYANWIIPAHLRGEGKTTPSAHLGGGPRFPCLGLLVSGGHTDLVLFTNHGKYKYLGGTRDDAAGECFDKCARLLGLPYPGGPHISKLAKKGDPTKFKLPIPMKGSKDLDFSYSGLKTAVANLVKTLPVIPTLNQVQGRNLKTKKQESRDPSLIVQDDNTLADLAATIENAIVQSLIDKVILALEKYPVKNIMIAGGVAANQKLMSELKLKIENLKLKINLHIPSANLCTDNGAMIASAAFFQKHIADPLKLQADPNLSL